MSGGFFLFLIVIYCSYSVATVPRGTGAWKRYIGKSFSDTLKGSMERNEGITWNKKRKKEEKRKATGGHIMIIIFLRL